MKPTPADQALLTRHPPERGPARSPVVIYTGCCCLMYLHSLGALLGAFLVGGVWRSPYESGVYFHQQQRIPLVHLVFQRLPNHQWLFWSSLVLVIPCCLPALVGLMILTYPWIWPQVEKFVGWNIRETFPQLNRPEWQVILAVFNLSAFIASFLPLMLVPAWILGWLRLNRRPPETVLDIEHKGLHKTILGAYVGGCLGLVLMIVLTWLGIDLTP